VTDAPFHADLADGPPDGRAVWLHAADGVRLRAGYWPGGDKGTVLLLPGRTEYIEKYGRAARDLLARGYSTLCIDFRGQGLADRLIADPLKGHVARFADYQLDMNAVVALASGMDRPAPLFLMAHSMGGAIGLQSLQKGLPVRAAAFSAPMWGVRVPALMRPIALILGHLMQRFGKGLEYAPTTGPQSYVNRVGFAGNMLTKDPAMWDFMVAHLQAEPGFSLGGPTVTWLAEALAVCRDLRATASPDIPAYCAVGTAERIVETGPIYQRMARWPNGRIEVFDHAEHEVMMELPPVRKRFFDAACALFDAHR
jgi:lysophospholipase